MGYVKVVTGPVRLVFTNLEKPDKNERGEEVYTTCILVDKQDEKTVSKIRDAVAQICEEDKGVWGNKIPKEIVKGEKPLRDGDEDEKGELFEGMYYMNVKSYKQPQLLQKNPDDPKTFIPVEPGSVDGGCYARVSMNLKAYSVPGNNGITAYCNGIQWVKDAPKVGGGSNVSDDFLAEDDVY